MSYILFYDGCSPAHFRKKTATITNLPFFNAKSFLFLNFLFGKFAQNFSAILMHQQFFLLGMSFNSSGRSFIIFNLVNSEPRSRSWSFPSFSPYWSNRLRSHGDVAWTITVMEIVYQKLWNRVKWFSNKILFLRVKGKSFRFFLMSCLLLMVLLEEYIKFQSIPYPGHC